MTSDRRQELKARKQAYVQEEILLSAVSLFARRGFRAVTIDDIASNLGYSKSVVYYYFKSKSEILWQIFARCFDDYFRMISTVASLNLGPRETLSRLIIEHAQHVMQRPEWNAIYYRDESELDDAQRRQIAMRKREYDAKLDVQAYVPEARPLRGEGTKRTCPTWHGGVAHQPTAYNPVKHIAYGVGAEGCFSQNGAAAAFKGPDGGLDRAKFEKRTYTSDLYYGAITAYDVINHKVLAKTVTDIEIRSGATVTAGGLVFSALQDGWVIAYDDEKLQELWRFNVGTPLKGAPIVFAIGPKEYLAVQSSGRHLHPVKYDNLEHSSYLFVFALN